MKAFKSLVPLFTVMLMLLGACGQTAPQQSGQPTVASGGSTDATKAPATTAPATDATPAAEAPTPAPTATAIPLSTIGSGAKKIVWWHISTPQKERDNWTNLATTYVKDHPDVSIEITLEILWLSHDFVYCRSTKYSCRIRGSCAD